MLKSLKKGFTLAEVLVTLTIIGVVSAIVMPNMMSNYQYKQIGVRVSKFMTTLENNARAYVAENDVLSANNFSTFAQETFSTANGAAFVNNANGGTTLKDGTSVRLTAANGLPAGVNVAQTGAAIQNVVLNTNVTGLPAGAHRSFTFVVTENGYVFPSTADPCLLLIIQRNFVTNTKNGTYNLGTACRA